VSRCDKPARSQVGRCLRRGTSLLRTIRLGTTQGRREPDEQCIGAMGMYVSYGIIVLSFYGKREAKFQRNFEDFLSGSRSICVISAAVYAKQKGVRTNSDTRLRISTRIPQSDGNVDFPSKILGRAAFRWNRASLRSVQNGFESAVGTRRLLMPDSLPYSP